MILDPESMHPLHVTRSRVSAFDVFPNQHSWKDIIRYIELTKTYKRGNRLPDETIAINSMKVGDGFVPEEISHQELKARDVVRQAGLICNAEFFKAIAMHSCFRDVHGFARQKRIIRDTLHVLNLLRWAGNHFRKNKVHTMLGSVAEVNAAWQCFGPMWPAGLNMYGILRDLYPAFHARITGQVPLYVAENLDSMLNAPASKHGIMGAGRFLVDDDGRFIGLYPVARVPAHEVTLDSPFISQDQMGRKAIAARMLDDIAGILRTEPDTPVVVIDYAGGPGNLSEVLLKEIFSCPDPELRQKLKGNVRSLVIDIAEDQLAAGRRRFERLNAKPELGGISDLVLFMNGDVTKPIESSLLSSLKEKLGLTSGHEPAFLGMTAYTLGALDNAVGDMGNTCAMAMAREISGQCRKLYAVDFSSPMWRLEDFIRDTGPWGKEYLRTIHGIPEDKDWHRGLPRIVETALTAWYGVNCGSIAEFVRSMAIGSALAAHYITVWPGSDGHNAGYTVLEDGSMKKPGILSFAETLQSYGAHVAYKSKIWLVATLDLGSAGAEDRAWAFVPGWMADFVVADMGKK